MRFIVRVLNRRSVRQLIIFLAIDALVFGSSNVKSVPSFMLMAGYVLLMATVYQLLYGLVVASRFYGVKIKRQRRLALYLTALAGVLVALQSIGELSPRDVVVLVPLMIIGYLYRSYGATSSRTA